MSLADSVDAPEEVYLISPVQRAIRLLQFVVDGGSTGNLSEAARQVGISRATLTRLLDTLEHERMLERLPEGGYQPGLRLLGLAAGALSARDLLQLARPVLAGLAAELGLTAYLTALSGGEVLYLLREVPDTPLVSNIKVGSRIAAHLTTPGRVLLAALPPDARRRLLGPEPLAAATAQSPRSYAELDRLLAADRAAGCAWSLAAYEAGVNACAAAVLDADGAAVAALSVVGPERQFGPGGDRPAAIETTLRRAARDLSRLLGAGAHVAGRP